MPNYLYSRFSFISSLSIEPNPVTLNKRYTFSDSSIDLKSIFFSRHIFCTSTKLLSPALLKYLTSAKLKVSLVKFSLPKISLILVVIIGAVVASISPDKEISATPSFIVSSLIPHITSDVSSF